MIVNDDPLKSVNKLEKVPLILDGKVWIATFHSYSSTTFMSIANGGARRGRGMGCGGKSVSAPRNAGSPVADRGGAAQSGRWPPQPFVNPSTRS